VIGVLTTTRVAGLAEECRKTLRFSFCSLLFHKFSLDCSFFILVSHCVRQRRQKIPPCQKGYTSLAAEKTQLSPSHFTGFSLTPYRVLLQCRSNLQIASDIPHGSVRKDSLGAAQNPGECPTFRSLRRKHFAPSFFSSLMARLLRQREKAEAVPSHKVNISRKEVRHG
jgi:hypothetical protein